MTRPSMRGLYRGSLSPFSKQEYIDTIEDIFRFITPSYMASPTPENTPSSTGAYALYRGVRLSSRGCGAAHSEDEMFDFVRRGIDSGNPVALLILRHRAPGAGGR